MKAAAAQPVVRRWTVQELASAKEAWDGLLAASSADPLFLSWDWQWRWWTHHATGLGASLQVLGIYSDGTLIGIAPFYSRKVLVRGFLPTRRLELIGTAWRHPNAAFSDYLDIISARGYERAVIGSVAGWLEAASWDDLALCCIRRGGLACELAESRLAKIAYVREVDEMTGWCAKLPERFEHFVENLSSDVRRRVFHQRRKLVSPRIEYAEEADIPQYLAQLWGYSASRWGGQASKAQQSFHLDMAATLARSGQLRLSRLSVGGAPLSIMYSVMAGGGVYYLQSGFDPAQSSGVSPGYLHFGYEIEASCREGAQRFDFLAGPGRHRDYKRDLLTEEVPVVSYHAVRQPLARMLHGAFQALQRCRKTLQFR